MITGQNYAGKQVLITGSEGFIGSNLTEKVLGMGASVRAFVLYNFKGDLGWISHLKDKVEVFFGDVRDYDAVEASMKDVDTVFHLAASISVPYSILHPREVVETNVMGTFNVLTAARKIGVGTVVHTSTSEVFGTPEYVPIDERHPRNPRSPYAASKDAADKLCKAFYCSYGLPVIIIRPFNTFGPRQSPRAIIPSIILQMSNGDVLRIGNLDPTRDFSYVEDTTDGILLAGLSKTFGEEINLGTGKEIAVGELVKLVARLMGKTRYEVRKERRRVRSSQVEVVRLIADNAKARRLLKWKPAYSLEEGLAKTIDWFSKHGDAYKYLDYL
jgi:NAD dependent epimerase/dehydratase